MHLECTIGSIFAYILLYIQIFTGCNFCRLTLQDLFSRISHISSGFLLIVHRASPDDPNKILRMTQQWRNL